jgi:predicted nuclease of restriction endonuclease-like RecB superfamily
VLAEVAAELGSTAEIVAKGLYADLPDEQIVLKAPEMDTLGLLRRYDLALAQSVLLHATELRIFLQDPTLPRMRQLFRWIKFHQLVATANRVGTELHVTLDGPMSMFKQSTRYGMQLASFLPALLLQTAWTARAEVIWSKRKVRRTFEISSEDGLFSPRADTGAWQSREQGWFAERFAQIDTGWALSDRTDPIDLKGRAVVLPDFTLTKDGRAAHLEIVGYWRKEWLERRLDALVKYGPGNLILAVSRKLVGDERLSALPGTVIEFAEVVPVKAVIGAADAVALPVR